MTDRSFSKFIPPAQSKVLRRQRLVQLLDQNFTRKATWISAPPGAGKTTLVADYIDLHRYPTFWFQIEPGDVVPATMFEYLNLAATNVFGIDARLLPAFTPEYSMGLKTFAARYFETLFSYMEDQSIIVFDDCQEAIHSELIIDIMYTAVSKVTPSLHLILLSRTQPPPQFARFIANQEICLLDWKHLRFNERESDSWLLSRGISEEEHRYKIVKAADGWAAGLILLEQSSHIENTSGENISDYQSIFDYFAAEILVTRSQEEQKLLCETALLPFTSINNAANLSLTERSFVASTLDVLHASHYFVERREEEGTFFYQYHPLFRRFLLNEFERSTSHSDANILRQRAAEILLDNSQFESVAELLIQSSDWRKMSELCLQRAPYLLQRGRNRVLLDWISKIPEDVIRENPDIYFWQALATQAYDPAKARDLFAVSFRYYRESERQTEMYLSWAGLVECYTVEWDDYITLDTWLEEYKKLQGSDQNHLPLAIEARLLGALVSCLLWRQGNSDCFDGVIERAVDVIYKLDDVNQQIMLATQLLWYFQFSGEISRAMSILSTLETRATNDYVSPLAKILWHNTVAAWGWFNGDYTGSVEHYQQSFAISEFTGIHVMDDMAYSQKAYTHLLMGNIVAANDALEKIETTIQPERRLALAHFHYLSGWKQVLSDELLAARDTLQLALNLTRRLGTPMPELMVTYMLCMAYLKLSDLAGAQECVDNLERLSNKTGSYLAKIELLMAQALVAYKFENSEQCLVRTRDALKFARSKQFRNYPGRIIELVTPIYALALKENIEVDYVLELIRSQNIKLTSLGANLEELPWPIRIRTMGNLSIEVNGQPLELATRQYPRPIALLCLLVANRDHPLSIDNIIECLWPDYEWEKSFNTFKANLARLRKLIGKEAVVQKKGKISLNAELCWIDAWHIHDLINEAGKENDPLRQYKLCGQLISQYNNVFLPDHADFWIINHRSLLQKSYLSCLLKVAENLRKADKAEESLALCESGLAMADPSEGFYLCSMQNLIRLGRFSGAVAVYHKYKKQVTTQGIKPNKKITALYDESLSLIE